MTPQEMERKIGELEAAHAVLLHWLAQLYAQVHGGKTSKGFSKTYDGVKMTIQQEIDEEYEAHMRQERRGGR